MEKDDTIRLAIAQLDCTISYLKREIEKLLILRVTLRKSIVK